MKVGLGSKQRLKIGKNEIEVTVIEKTEKGYLVESENGKTFPVNNLQRFIQVTEPPASKPEKKMSMLAAAVEVLSCSREAMSAKELIKAMIETNLWIPGKGKTPHNTLHSALSRELKTNPKASFRKSITRGNFKTLPETHLEAQK